MKQSDTSSPIARLLMAAIVCLNAAACTQAVESADFDEPTQTSSDELFLAGKTWGSTVTVCYIASDTSASDIQNLFPEAQRVLASTWSRSTPLKFLGRSPTGLPQANWGPCDRA